MVALAEFSIWRSASVPLFLSYSIQGTAYRAMYTMQLGWTQAIRIAWGRGQRIHKWLNCRIDRAAIWGPCMQSGNPALYAMVYLYLYLFIGVFHLALHCWKAAGGWWSGFSSKSVLWTNLRIFPGRRICLVHLEGIIFILFFLEAEVPDCRLVFQRVVGWDIYSNSSNLFWHFWLKVQKRGNLELQFGRLPWLSFPRKSLHGIWACDPSVTN